MEGTRSSYSQIAAMFLLRLQLSLAPNTDVALMYVVNVSHLLGQQSMFNVVAKGGNV